jgi:hypothetical protein
MADGIRITDAALEISPAGLDALVKRQGAQVTVTHLDLSISPEALNTLLGALAPQGEPAPTAALSQGRLQVTGQKDGSRMSVDLRVGGFKVEITEQGLRLVSE